MTRAKVCGLTNLADAQCAVEAGADMLGFIFHPPSPRAIQVARAARVVDEIRATYGDRTPLCVGVFVNEPPVRVRAVIDEVGLDLAQLHGDEPASSLECLRSRAYKAIRPRTAQEAADQAARYAGAGAPAAGPDLLVDAYDPDRYGGTAVLIDTAVVGPLVRRWRVLLAGGLTPANVGEVIRIVRPWGVDVASGVERAKGRKDHALVEAFIQVVRAVDDEIERNED